MSESNVIPAIRLIYGDGTEAEIASVLSTTDEIRVRIKRPPEQPEIPPAAAQISDQGWGIINDALRHYEESRRRISRKRGGDFDRVMSGVWELFKHTRARVESARRQATVKWDEARPGDAEDPKGAGQDER